MSPALSDVSDASLERILDGLSAGRLRAPLTRTELVAYGVKGQLDAVVSVLEGHSGDACRSILTAVLAERAKFERPAPELVWTGPEGNRASARDTAVVLRELFESAQQRVVLAGYTFTNARNVLKPLHDAMLARNVNAHFFVDVPQTKRSLADPEAYGRRCLDEFLAQNWPFGAPRPQLYCDIRALRPREHRPGGNPGCILHSKCVSVDGRRAYVSSANFTMSGQENNIETGVLIHDATFAGQLERQWLGLVDAGLVYGLLPP